MGEKQLNFSFCIDAVYKGLSLAEKLNDLKKHGFTKLECWTLGSKPEEGFAELLEELDLTLTAFCPDCFVLNDPAMHDAYLAGLEKALRQAKRLHCASLITQVGQDNGKPYGEQKQSVIEGLRKAVPLLEEANVTLLVEPLNTVKDHRGYLLSSSEEAFDIIRSVDSPRVKVLFDVYHQLHMGEDVMKMITNNLKHIGHFHIAGYPNRNEKLFAETYDYGALLQWMRDNDVSQPIGIELFPSDVAGREQLFRHLQEEA